MLFDKILDMLNIDNWENSNDTTVDSVVECSEAEIAPECSETSEAEIVIECYEAPKAEITIECSEAPEAEITPKCSEDSEAETAPECYEDSEAETAPECYEAPETETAPECSEDSEIIFEDTYKSDRMLIPGLHIFFIDIAREIVNEHSVNIIPLMREYNLSENELNKIIADMQDAQIIDDDRVPLINPNELERLIDIYKPNLFKCNHTQFDKELFMCMGEIIFDGDVEDVYNSLSADEVIDYLNIMERLNIIAYNAHTNKYEIKVNKDTFYNICKYIPNSFSSKPIDFSDKNIKINFDNLSGTQFENFAAYILSKNNFENIKSTPHSGDHGIDLLAQKDGISYAIQCKCYSGNIGNAAVQQAHTGKALYKCDIAVVLTNRYFTPQALEEANALGVKLWDRDKLMQLIDNIAHDLD